MGKASKKNKNSVLLLLILVINLFFALALVLSLTAKIVEPSKNIYIAFLGLAYPILIYVNIGFAFFWAIRKNKFFLISIVAILITFSNLPKYFQYSSSRNIENETENQIKILSYNIQTFKSFFDHKSKDYLDSLVVFLKEMNPDILCFQEFYNDKEFEIEITKFIKENLELNYHHFNKHLVRYNKYEFGIATFSKFPIINKGRIENVNVQENFVSQNYSIFTDLLVYGDTIRVYNVHLESNRLSNEDVFFSVFEDFQTEDVQQQSKKILAKLKRAFIARSKQVVPIREHLDECIYPVILCGDFNDTPASWTYNQLSKGLQDAFVKAGRGTGKTYIGLNPSFRIDYILLDTIFEVHYFDTPQVIFSDHYPIFAVFSKRNIIDKDLENTSNEK